MLNLRFCPFHSFSIRDFSVAVSLTHSDKFSLVQRGIIVNVFILNSLFFTILELANTRFTKLTKSIVLDSFLTSPLGSN